MARKAFTEHPQFTRASFVANEVLGIALEDLGLEMSHLNAIEPHADRTVDDLTRLLLRAYDAKHSKAAA